jgi:hypothetical protein
MKGPIYVVEQSRFAAAWQSIMYEAYYGYGNFIFPQSSTVAGKRQLQHHRGLLHRPW